MRGQKEVKLLNYWRSGIFRCTLLRFHRDWRYRSLYSQVITPHERTARALKEVGTHEAKKNVSRERKLSNIIFDLRKWLHNQL